MTDLPPDLPPDAADAAPPGPARHHPTVSIAEEMQTSFLDYAMSVIISRAIPDLRDGLKPVQRRILYAMDESGNTHDKAYRKSARPVGDVMGKYHPHGDSSIYEALVRMAQDFSMSLPLLDGQGNFGSMDGDNPAAMRYTEVRMDRPAAFIMADIDKDTVDFQDNYDGKDREPTVLPARFPNMLVNGAGGIAVGMATNIPPHNLGEVVDATLALIEDPDLTSEDLIQYVPGPDFPTGGQMLGRSGARKAYLEGRGSVIIRSKTHEEQVRGRQAIVVDEIPYQVNKATMIDRIAEAARDKRIEGISHVQDESDRNGVRVVIELRRDATPEVVLNQLWRFTPMQTSFAANMLALNGGRPEVLTLRGFLSAFLDFREEVVARRTAFELRRARERAHILCGLAVAVSNVDEVVATIRASADAGEARERLMTRAWPAGEIAPFIRLIDDPTHGINPDGTYNLSDAQVRAILDLRLQRLTQLGVQEVTDELQDLAGRITDYLAILGSRERIMGIIADELREVRGLFAGPRRTEIAEWAADLDDEDLIEREEMVVTVTQGGWIKRTPLTEFRAQRRGGKGLSSMATKEEDVVTRLFVANTHTPLLFFTSDGMSYKLKCWRLPLAGRTAKGRAMTNLLPIETGTGVAAILPIDRPEDEWGELQIVFATSTGDVRRNALSDFTDVRRNGKIAMKLPEDTRLVNARIASEDDDVLLVTDHGRAIRFPTTDVRVFQGRSSTGVRGIGLRDETDHVVSMAIIRHFEATPEERGAYLKMRRAVLGAPDEEAVPDEDEPEVQGAISPERYAEMSAAEDLILTVTSGGLGKLSSSHDYPVRGRGGQGVVAMDLTERRGRDTGRIVAAMPVERSDQVMLVTEGGQSIRVPVDGISFRSRGAGGVRVFDTGEDPVASVALVAEETGADED
jgi:DNA gyrase subunit A